MISPFYPTLAGIIILNFIELIFFVSYNFYVEKTVLLRLQLLILVKALTIHYSYMRNEQLNVYLYFANKFVMIH